MRIGSGMIDFSKCLVWMVWLDWSYKFVCQEDSNLGTWTLSLDSMVKSLSVDVSLLCVQQVLCDRPCPSSSSTTSHCQSGSQRCAENHSLFKHPHLIPFHLRIQSGYPDVFGDGWGSKVHLNKRASLKLGWQAAPAIAIVVRLLVRTTLPASLWRDRVNLRMMGMGGCQCGYGWIWHAMATESI